MTFCDFSGGITLMEFVGFYNGEKIWRCSCCHHHVLEFDKSSHRCNHWIRETHLDQRVRVCRQDLNPGPAPGLLKETLMIKAEKLRPRVQRGLISKDEFFSWGGKTLHDCEEIVQEFVARGGVVLAALRRQGSDEIVCYEYVSLKQKIPRHLRTKPVHKETQGRPWEKQCRWIKSLV